MMSFMQLEPPMDEHEQRKVANNCVNFVCKDLAAYSGPNGDRKVFF
jgi:hypothetical protein